MTASRRPLPPDIGFPHLLASHQRTTHAVFEGFVGSRSVHRLVALGDRGLTARELPCRLLALAATADRVIGVGERLEIVTAEGQGEPRLRPCPPELAAAARRKGHAATLVVAPSGEVTAWVLLAPSGQGARRRLWSWSEASGWCQVATTPEPFSTASMAWDHRLGALVVVGHTGEAARVGEWSGSEWTVHPLRLGPIAWPQPWLALLRSGRRGRVFAGLDRGVHAYAGWGVFLGGLNAEHDVSPASCLVGPLTWRSLGFGEDRTGRGHDLVREDVDLAFLDQRADATGAPEPPPRAPRRPAPSPRRRGADATTAASAFADRGLALRVADALLAGAKPRLAFDLDAWVGASLDDGTLERSGSLGASDVAVWRDENAYYLHPALEQALLDAPFAASALATVTALDLLDWPRTILKRYVPYFDGESELVDPVQGLDGLPRLTALAEVSVSAALDLAPLLELPALRRVVVALGGKSRPPARAARVLDTLRARGVTVESRT